MSFEVEKRYLLSGLPSFPASAKGPFEYHHGFLPGTTIKERVTIRPGTYDGTKGPSWKRTVKVGTGVRRFEFAEDLDEATFDFFWKMTEGKRIYARRWKVPDLDLTLALAVKGDKALHWEVSEHSGNVRIDGNRKDPGLVLCEMELPEHVVRIQGDQVRVPRLDYPSWLAPFVVTDVTDDASYENFNLAC